MKRFHVHVRVPDIDRSARFYSALFGTDPSVAKPDYVKWELEEPRVNFAISLAGDRAAGVDHLGIQVTESAELNGVHSALSAAEVATIDQTAASCCYAVSDKHWANSPEGVTWEVFHTMAEAAVYGEERRPNSSTTSGPHDAARSAGTCCPGSEVESSKNSSCC